MFIVLFKVSESCIRDLFESVVYTIALYSL